jgi:hypothetical protein
LGNRVEQLRLNADQELNADVEPNTGHELNTDETTTDFLQHLQEEQNLLSTSRKLLDELLSKSQEEVIAKVAAENQARSTIVTFGNNNSGLQAGVINGPVSFGGK